MITARTKNENFLHYLIMEIIMVAVVTFIGVAFMIFYFSGRSDNRTNTNKLQYLFDHPFIFFLLCFLPVVVGVSFLLYFRNRNYIVGYLFDHDKKLLSLLYRKISNKHLYTMDISFQDVLISDFNERKILFNQTYKGKTLKTQGTNQQLDFVTNNFIWEEDPRKKMDFLEELYHIDPTNKIKVE